MTIKDAALQVLKDAGRALTVDEIYELICSSGLFEFKAKQPKSVLSRQLRSHCEGIELKLASGEKCFRIVENGKFALKA